MREFGTATDRKEKLDTLHGIWLWHHIGTSPPARPILYANPDIEDLKLPGSALEVQAQHARTERRRPYPHPPSRRERNVRPAVLVKAWQEYPKKRPDEVL